MLTAEGKTVLCKVTRDALSVLFKGPGGIGSIGQLAVFNQCRDHVEAIASQKWDCSQLDHGTVLVKAEDVKSAGYA